MRLGLFRVDSWGYILEKLRILADSTINTTVPNGWMPLLACHHHSKSRTRIMSKNIPPKVILSYIIS